MVSNVRRIRILRDRAVSWDDAEQLTTGQSSTFLGDILAREEDVESVVEVLAGDSPVGLLRHAPGHEQKL